MKKRYIAKKPKPGEIRISYGKLDGDYSLVYCYDDSDLETPDKTGKKTNKVFMHLIEAVEIFDTEQNLLELLHERGYDITTLEIRVKRKNKDSRVPGGFYKGFRYKTIPKGWVK